MKKIQIHYSMKQLMMKTLKIHKQRFEQLQDVKSPQQHDTDFQLLTF